MKPAIIAGMFMSCCVANWAWAQTPSVSTPPPAALKSAENSHSSSTPSPDDVTTVVGSREAPSISNILPWRVMSEEKLTKEDVTSSVLQESLDPLDPETLNREIEFHKALDTTPKD